MGARYPCARTTAQEPGGPLGPLGFKCSQHRQTRRPSVDGIRSKAPDVIRKEAWSSYRTVFGGRLCWELEPPKGPKGTGGEVGGGLGIQPCVG